MNISIAGAKNAPKPGRETTVLRVGTLIVDSQTVHQPGYLAFKDKQIVAADAQDPSAQFPGAVQWVADDYICAPGLINAHTHVALAYLRGLGHGQADMIEKLFFTTESHLDADLLEPLSYSYIIDGLRSGVTCFGDHYYFIEGVAAALQRIGVRGAVAETIQDLGGPFKTSMWPRAKRRLENWSYGSLVKPVVGPHATDTLSPKLLSEVAAFARSNDLPLHMHLSQTHHERNLILKRDGQSPVALAERCGALGPKTLAVHLVATDEDDWRRIHATGTTVGLCPSSQIIYEHLAPLKGLLLDQTPAVLGNDCAASNDSADLLSEARVLGLLTRQAGVALSPQRIFEIMTVNAAQVFGLPCGTLQPGRAADLFLVRKDITLEPMDDPLTQLIYSGANRNVEHVLIDGAWVMFNRQLQQAGEQDLREQFRLAVREIHQRVGGPHARI